MKTPNRKRGIRYRFTTSMLTGALVACWWLAWPTAPGITTRGRAADASDHRRGHLRAWSSAWPCS